MERIRLPKGGVISIGVAQPDFQVTSESGTLWITQTGDRRDHIVRPGGHFQGTRHHRLVIEALEPAVLLVPYVSKQAARGVA